MAAEISFTFLGEPQIRRRLERFEHALEDARPALEEMHTDFLKIEKRQFNSEGRYGSGGWKPLSDDYVKHKQWMIDTKRISGGWVSIDPRILHLTRRLELSLTEGTNYQHIKEVTKDHARFGTTVPYAIVHQNPKSKMPARKPIQLTENNRQGWVKILQKHLGEALGSKA